jgi:FKBP-type peptidyl-prolyl cis-trans isomerase FkpA
MKLNKTIWLVMIALVMVGVSCTSVGYKKTKSGLEYKIFEGSGKGQALKPGDIVKFEYKITYKDSLLASSYGVVPGYDMVDSAGRPHEFSELLKELKVGDSLVTFQIYDTMKSLNPMQAPSFMKKGEKIKTTLKVLGAFKSRDSVMVDYQNEVNKFKSRELTVLKKYIDGKGIKAELVNDVYVEVTDKGAGVPVIPGKEVSIKYTGYNLEGKFFDSNMDSTKQTMKHDLSPYPFIAGQTGAIQGILVGVLNFNKGGKGRLFIPSALAYGPAGSPPAIQPNENLIFDIEIVDVKDAQMPQQMPMPGQQ